MARIRSGTIVFVEAVATMKSYLTLLKRSVQCMVPSAVTLHRGPDDAAWICES